MKPAAATAGFGGCYEISGTLSEPRIYLAV
jgi:hypothetical protein